MEPFAGESKLTFLHCINMQMAFSGRIASLSGQEAERQARYAAHIWLIREL